MPYREAQVSDPFSAALVRHGQRGPTKRLAGARLSQVVG